MLSSFLLAAALLQRVQCQQSPIAIPPLPEDSNPVPNNLQSFSLEFCFFPDYAGNKTHPNKFSKNLLDNFERITGVPPAVRIGGTTQDHSFYVPDQKENIKLFFENPDDDQPQTVKYGPAFFESYHNLGDNIPFSHGLNFNQQNTTQQEESAIAACKSIDNLKLLELGNEINMQAPDYRSKGYTLQDYIQEWNQRAGDIKDAIENACPDNTVDFMAPTWIAGLFKASFPLNPNNWQLEQLFKNGFDSENITAEVCMHTYMDVNEPPYAPAAIDLQATYMNHTNIVRNLAPHISRAKNLAYLGHPYVLGETNSMAKQGRPGVSNTFGNALWLVDFSLWAAEHNIHRLHFHQGLNYRYTSWQPIDSKGNKTETRPNYYGQIMVASALGKGQDNRIVNIPLEEDTESAYALYDGITGRVTKLVVVNFRVFNSSTTSTSSSRGDGDDTRPGRDYTFKIPRSTRTAKIERLIAPGSDALGNVMFAGVSYDYELAKGEPVVVDEEAGVEVKRVRNGNLSVNVPDSSAVLVTFV